MYDESTQFSLPQAGCEYQAFYTGVLTEENVGLRVITEVTEDITYTNVTWNGDNQKVSAALEGTLTGEVKRIDLGFSAVDNNRRATLENPASDSHSRVSGIGQITGWACSDLDLEIQIYVSGYGVVERFPVPHGVSRADTEEVCGDALNGFSAVSNWNRIPQDSDEALVHLVQQGKIIATASVQVVHFEDEFIRGAEGSAVVYDFPEPGQSVTIEWVQGLQNFVITEFQE
ncbi:MAG: hypothetical protein OXC18_07000 [Desulfurellaceae bacterium]|nr:hypothetical protein [Desulfurellaceae bacterium]